MGMIEDLPCAALVLDMVAWRPLAFNKHASDMLRYSTSEFEKLTITDFEFVPNPAETREHVAALRRTRHDDFQCVHRAKSGEAVPMRIRLNVVQWDDRDAMLVLWDRAPGARPRAAVQAASVVEGPEIVAASACMMELLQLADRIAPTELPVLLQGETGTGKDLLAQRIHARSKRATRAFMPINCASLPAEIIDAELFGVERGAFTGADRRRAGRFEAADGGTVFLDELGELPMVAQAKLLRVLQSGEIHRLGAALPSHVDVRVIAATNRNLADLVHAGRFRADLYHRLAGLTLTVPPLRERPEDIEALIAFALSNLEKAGLPRSALTEHDRNRLRSWTWPGNARELLRVIESSAALSGERPLSLSAWTPSLPAPLMPLAEPRLELATRSFVLAALEECGWVVEGPEGAAARLGLKPSTLRSKMIRLQIRRTT